MRVRGGRRGTAKCDVMPGVIVLSRMGEAKQLLDCRELKMQRKVMEGRPFLRRTFFSLKSSVRG